MVKLLYCENNPMDKITITITFGEQAENHVGMQQIGNGLSDKGYSIEDLVQIKERFEKIGSKVDFIKLNDFLEEKNGVEEAGILIIRNGVDILLEDKIKDNLFEVLNSLDWDKKVFMYGSVKNKRARYNLVFDDNGQEPDYENKKGRIIKWSDVELLKQLKEKIEEIVGEEIGSLKGEGNKYYDINKCGIGFHGDGERKKVIAVRLGESLKLYYQWFYKYKGIGDMIEILLNSGDIYIMSEKASGFDWKKSSKYTLRHATGADKYLKVRK